MAEEDILVPYHTARQVELAAALVVQELGLAEALVGLVKDQQAASTGGSLQLLFGTSDDKPEDEAAVLGELFDTPDLPAVEKEEEVTEDMFHKAALLVVGVAGMVGRATTDLEKVEVLGSGEVEPPAVYTILSYFHQSLGAGGEGVEPWLREATTALTKLLNSKLQHTLLAVSTEICLQFLEDSFATLASVELAVEQRYRLATFLALLGQGRVLGRHAVTTVVARFAGVAEELRRAEQYRCSAAAALEEFEVLVNLVLELWPGFLASLVPARTAGGRERRGGEEAEELGRRGARKRSLGGGVTPQLTLAETSEVQEEVRGWREVLAGCTAHLSILQPDFCEAVWRVDAFCRGLLDALG